MQLIRDLKNKTGKWGDNIFRLLVAISLALWLSTGNLLMSAYFWVAGNFLVFIFFVRKGVHEAIQENASGIEKIDRSSSLKEPILILNSAFRKLGYSTEILSVHTHPNKIYKISTYAKEAPIIMIYLNQNKTALMLFYKSSLKVPVNISKESLEKGPKLLKDYKVSKVVLATNGIFEENSKQNVQHYNWIELWDRKTIIELLLKAEKMQCS